MSPVSRLFLLYLLAFLNVLAPSKVDAFATPRPTVSTQTTCCSQSQPLMSLLEPHQRSTPRLSMSRNANEVQGTDRILSSLPYLLPLMDGDRYGRFLFAILPPLGLADALLLGPFKMVYYSIPFAQLGTFIALSFLSRNSEIPRSIRFNMQQALILDILLIFPSLFGRLPFAIPRVLVESGSNFVFFVLVASVGYSLFSNLSGKLPNQIPVVSDATESQIGPF